jgi:hypothetical protein
VWESVGPDEWRVHISRKPLQRPDPVRIRGFARRFRAVKTTSDWLAELREAGDDK